MADEVDISNDFYQRIEERNILGIRAAASEIPAGVEGECIECGLESKRLVNGMCAPCRDMIY